MPYELGRYECECDKKTQGIFKISVYKLKGKVIAYNVFLLRSNISLEKSTSSSTLFYSMNF